MQLSTFNIKHLKFKNVMEKYDIRDDTDMFRVAATVAQSYAVV